jgi:hypothetical protein
LRRIDKAFEKFIGMARCQIVPTYCPCDVDTSWDDVDLDTYRLSGNGHYNNESGCRGITCEECWDKDT